MSQNIDSLSFAERIKQLIKAIPAGKVATYGQIAMMAGNPGGVRGVVWILHSSSQKEGLPWHRVINRKGKISLLPGQGFEEQKARLEAEGVQFDWEDRIDLDRFLWRPGGQWGSKQMTEWKKGGRVEG